VTWLKKWARKQVRRPADVALVAGVCCCAQSPTRGSTPARRTRGDCAARRRQHSDTGWQLLPAGRPAWRLRTWKMHMPLSCRLKPTKPRTLRAWQRRVFVMKDAMGGALPGSETLGVRGQALPIEGGASGLAQDSAEWTSRPRGAVRAPVSGSGGGEEDPNRARLARFGHVSGSAAPGRLLRLATKRAALLQRLQLGRILLAL